MDNITTFITSLTALIIAISGIIAAIIKAYKDIKKETLPKKIKKQSEIDNVIINKMEETKEILNADRVHIYDFHNRRPLCRW